MVLSLLSAVIQQISNAATPAIPSGSMYPTSLSTAMIDSDALILWETFSSYA
jgi:hypothetical protein